MSRRYHNGDGRRCGLPTANGGTCQTRLGDAYVCRRHALTQEGQRINAERRRADFAKREAEEDLRDVQRQFVDAARKNGLDHKETRDAFAKWMALSKRVVL